MGQRKSTSVLPGPVPARSPVARPRLYSVRGSDGVQLKSPKEAPAQEETKLQQQEKEKAAKTLTVAQPRRVKSTEAQSTSARLLNDDKIKLASPGRRESRAGRSPSPAPLSPSRSPSPAPTTPKATTSQARGRTPSVAQVYRTRPLAPPSRSPRATSAPPKEPAPPAAEPAGRARLMSTEVVVPTGYRHVSLSTTAAERRLSTPVTSSAEPKPENSRRLSAAPPAQRKPISRAASSSVTVVRTTQAQARTTAAAKASAAQPEAKKVDPSPRQVAPLRRGTSIAQRSVSQGPPPAAASKLTRTTSTQRKSISQAGPLSPTPATAARGRASSVSVQGSNAKAPAKPEPARLAARGRTGSVSNTNTRTASRSKSREPAPSLTTVVEQATSGQSLQAFITEFAESARSGDSAGARLKMKAMFDTLDRSGDGLVEASELMAVFNLTRSNADELIEHMDHSRDGKVTFEEFCDWFGLE
eukprot:c33383_g1_i1.p1 GENE.c33383_g1_i1~~c33383_g1_i1.p1  ORF type:complete len:472 (-),score=69.02 c33383_g1_i1:21-1436(-)